MTGTTSAPAPRPLWRRWVDLWSRTEQPTTIALLRIMLAAIVFADQVAILQLGLVETLWAPADAGGLGDPMAVVPPPLLYRLFAATTTTTWVAFGLWVLSTLTFCVGLFSRLSGLLMVLLYAQFALILPGGDRGIDMLLRNALLVLALGGSGATLSLDARWRTGSWLGDGAERPAWPRYLLIIQLVIVYFTAGVQKVGIAWLPVGHFSALYIVLQDPAVAKTAGMDLSAWWHVTQFATATTMIWEWSAPLLLLAFYYRDTRDRPGRLRALFNRIDFRAIYLFIGVLFHVGIHLTMRIGIFPFAMMALYLCGYHPDELRRLWPRLVKRNSA